MRVAPLALTRATSKLLELMDAKAEPAQLLPVWLDCVEGCMRRAGHTDAEITAALESVAITDQATMGALSDAMMGE